MTDPDDLRAGIVRTTTRRFEQLVTALPSRHPEVGDLDILVSRQHDILGLEVSMTDGEMVAIIETADDLLKVLGGLVGFEASGRDEEFKELSALNVFEDEVAVGAFSHFDQFEID